MAINVTTAHNQAAEIANKVGQLRSARNRLARYKADLQSNWLGKEVCLITESIDQAIAEIDAMIGSLTTLSNDIRNAADTIHQEEKAAAEAAAARAAQKQKLAQARSAYNASCDELDAIAKEREALIMRMRNTKSMRTLEALNKQLIEIDKKLAAAQEACNQCRTALDAAGR